MLCLQYQYTLLFYKMARQAIDLADSVTYTNDFTHMNATLFQPMLQSFTFA